jgi:hypothetical protein
MILPDALAKSDLKFVNLSIQLGYGSIGSSSKHDSTPEHLQLHKRLELE